MNNFSIIIPIYNCSIIGEVLQSFLNVDYPRNNFEIILVDDGSDAKEKLRAQYYVNIFKANLDISYKYIEDKNGEMRVNKARNMGADVAKYPNLIFVDGDCLVPDYYLKHYDSYLEFRDLKSEIIVGDSIGYNYEDIDPIEPKDILEKNYNKYLFLPKYRDFRRIGHYKHFWHVFLGGNFCIDKDVFIDIGKWDENIVSWGEDDIDFSFRAFKLGYHFSFLKRVEVYNIKDLERMTVSRFHSTLENQCYVYAKTNYNVEYLEYVRQRFRNTENIYKQENIPKNFVDMFYENNFLTNFGAEKFITITIHLDEKDNIGFKYLEKFLKRGVYVNIIGSNILLSSKELLQLKQEYFFKISLCTSEYLYNLYFTQMYKSINYREGIEAIIDAQKYGPIVGLEIFGKDIEKIDDQWFEKLIGLDVKYISLDELQTYSRI